MREINLVVAEKQKENIEYKTKKEKL